MRVVTVLAAVAALWAMPAQAIDIDNGVFNGVINSGTATIQRFDAPDEVVDLTGLSITLGIDITTTTEALIDAYFSIPGASNPLTKGYGAKGFNLAPAPVSQDGNMIFVDAGYVGNNNNSLSLDLYGQRLHTTLFFLAGSISGNQYGMGSDYFRVHYDITASLYGAGEVIGGGIPEPATWGLMILGIGMVGAAMRLRQGHVATYNLARRFKGG